MPVLDSYSFGRLTIDGESFAKDVIIFPDGRILSPWWRKQGHRLEANDLEELIRTEPEIIVAGTGYSGLMKPTEELVRLLADQAIEFIAQRTGKAVQSYNQLAAARKVGGCFHLTC